jgi:surface antigen
VRLLELTLLGLVASILFAVTANAAIPGSAPTVRLGQAAFAEAPWAERPVPVQLPRPKAAVAHKKAPLAHPRAVTTVAKPVTRTPVRSAPVAPRHVATVAAPTADSYPYRTSQTNDLDAWGFTQRQCVSYAAWRLAQAGRAISNQNGGWGSASGWDDAARRLGFTVSSHPTVGSIAQWNAGEASKVWAGSSTGTFTAGGYGHVAYVTQVFADGSVQVAQYNATGNRAFSTMRMTAPRFLHIS